VSPRFILAVGAVFAAMVYAEHRKPRRNPVEEMLRSEGLASGEQWLQDHQDTPQ
jgi:hypothetical protein